MVRTDGIDITRLVKHGNPFFTSRRRHDDTVGLIIDDCYRLAKQTLIGNREQLDKMAKSLIEKEVLEFKEIEDLLGKRA
ncbi:MAG TPA: hypothetical protein VEM40_00005 [Nitrospirota bacterium]|nr:hypothetical protein [Nitrospirota bacterium]